MKKGKKTGFLLFLAAEAILCLWFVFVWKPEAGTGLGLCFRMLELPFQGAGLFLSWLSVRGSAGNGLAWMLWAVIGLVPIWYLYYRRRKGKLYPEDGLMAVLAILLWVSVYLQANPGLLNGIEAAALMQELLGGQFLFSGAVWSVLAGFLVLRFLRVNMGSSGSTLWHHLKWVLAGMAVLFVAAAFGVSLAEGRSALAALRESNEGMESGLLVTELFLGLRTAARMISCLLDAALTLEAMELAGEMAENRHSQQAVDRAQHFSRSCTRVLVFVILLHLGIQLLQLCCLGALRDVDSQLSFPVLSVCFVLVSLLFAGIIGENRELKQDNELFI